MNKKGQAGYIIGVSLFLVIAIIVLSIIGGAFYSVGEGEVGVMFHKFGENAGFVGEEYPQGWGFKTPFRDRMMTIPFRTQTIEFFEGGKGEFIAIQPRDLNGINFFVDVTVRYRLDPTQASEFVEQKGEGIFAIEKILTTAVRADSTRGVFGKYAQEDIPNTRIDIAKEIKQVLQERVDSEASGKLQPGFIVIEAVDIRNVKFDQRIDDAIVAKQTQKQIAEKQVYNLQIAEKEKEIAIVNAEREKAAKILIAEGEGEAVKIVAFAKAEGIQAVNNAYQFMPQEYVQVKFAEAIKPTDKVYFGFDSLGGNTLSIMDINQAAGLVSQNKIANSEE